jgi:uncharacterized protein involved in type VI secretion and phage assembly
MTGVIDIIRRVVEQEIARNRAPLLAVVTANYPHAKKDDDFNYEIDVRLKHEDLELHKVPLATAYMGAAVLPKVGDLVLVEFVGGDINQPVVTGLFYHADERPPLHKKDEVLFEQRVASDKSLNHLRMLADGSMLLQRKVTKPEDNSEAQTSFKVDGKTGDLEAKFGKKVTLTVSEEKGVNLKVGDKITIEISDSGGIKITGDGKNMEITVDKLNVKGEVNITGNTKIDGTTTITKDTTIQGKATVGMATKTIIDGNKIAGA